MPALPWLIGLLGAGGAGGFVAGKGLDGIGDIIKYAAIIFVVFTIAKQMKVI